MSNKELNNNSNQINYHNLKDPYYLVSVGLDDNSIRLLPDFVHRAIKSVEITEVIDYGQSNDMAIITFIDAYENVTPTSDALFNQHNITGRPGNILDLRIDSSNKIRILSADQLKQQQLAAVPKTQLVSQTVISDFRADVTAVTNGSGGIEITLNANVPDNVVGSNIFLATDNPKPFTTETPRVLEIIASNKILVSSNFVVVPPRAIVIKVPSTITEEVVIGEGPKAPKYLFQEGNIIEIEWGYKSSTKLRRKMRFIIQYFEYSATEVGNPEAKVFCIPKITYELTKFAPKIAQPFGNILSDRTMKDMTFGEIVKKIADSAGYDSVISRKSGAINYDDRNDNDNVKVAERGVSIDSFLRRLAQDNGCHYFTLFNVKSKKDTIYFLNDEDFSKFAIFVFTWKAPGSILLSYNLVANFDSINSGSAASIDPSTGKLVSDDRSQAKLTVDMKTGSTLNASQVTPPLRENLQTGLEKVFTGGVTGVSISSPSTNAQTINTQLDKHQVNNERSLIIRGTMIGYPLVAPCVSVFENIGLRFSGRYRITTTKHTIDPSGYKVEYVADKNIVLDGLVKTDKLPGSGDDKPGNISVLLTKSLSDTDAKKLIETIDVNHHNQDKAANFNTLKESPGKAQ